MMPNSAANRIGVRREMSEFSQMRGHLASSESILQLVVKSAFSESLDGFSSRSDCVWIAGFSVISPFASTR